MKLIYSLTSIILISFSNSLTMENKQKLAPIRAAHSGRAYWNQTKPTSSSRENELMLQRTMKEQMLQRKNKSQQFAALANKLSDESQGIK
jgi:hypothetical protein